MTNKTIANAAPFCAHPFDDDKLKEECGVFGVFGHQDAAALTGLGLHGLQHRGQEACGIVSTNGEQFFAHRDMGLVGENFSEPEVLARLSGNVAIGHNRYATTGGAALARNIQPLYADLSFGGFAIGHNGNLTNSHKLRQQLVQNGAIFQSTTDTEVIIHLMATSRYDTVKDRMVDALRHIKGAYSLVACDKECMIGVRDPHGIRPLVLGKLGDAYILSSETCSLDIIGAEYIRDIEPGEMVIFNEKGMQSHKPFEKKSSRFCVFEYIYFARPDSYLNERSVYETRKNIGVELAKESPCDVDLIVPVPDSGVPSAIGYAEESGIPFELGIIRSHYIGRTFIEPTDNIRNLGVRMKHNANKKFIEGKRVVLVDDSIVRGTTSRKIVDMMRQAGATEVHMRISSPPVKHSCFYGIDTPSTESLLAFQKDIDEIKDHIGVDSLAYISVEGLYRATGEKERNAKSPQYCDACFTGEYAVDLVDRDEKLGGNISHLRQRKTKRG